MADDNNEYRLGDADIEAQYKEMMAHIAEALDDFFNEGKSPRHTGFVLMVFDYNTSDGRCNYISNGANRSDVLKLLKEQARYFEEDLKIKPTE